MARRITLNRDVEFRNVVVVLNQFSGLFYAMVNLGNVRWSAKVKTAAVRYDSTGYALEWLFNTVFWDKLDDYQRAFVLAHECLHYILEHGTRLDLTDKTGNYAADMVVNQMLISDFGFDVDKLGWLADGLIWVETLLPDAGYGDTVEQYHAKIKDLKELPPDLETCDNHGGLGNGDLNEFDDSTTDPCISRSEIDRGVEHGVSNLSEDEQKKVKRQLQQVNKRTEANVAGTVAAGIERKLVIRKPKPSRRWEKIIHRWANERIKESEHWISSDRRWLYGSGDILIPSTHEQADKGKLDVMFFIDASISCADQSERFVRAARSLPSDRFRVLLRSFDTEVYEVGADNVVRGFGGTAFQPLENHALEQRKYPDAVFVLTDGYGNTINPMFPKRWYWFITEDGYDGLINKKSHIHHLENFEHTH
jgi:predicted metal-dependent peptidase